MADMRKQLSYTAAEIDERLGAVPNKVDKVTGKGLSTNDYTDADKTAVGTIGDKVDKVTGKGLSTNDYTDEDKAAVGTIGDKVDKVSGKGLSTNDFTNAYKTKVDNIHGLESNITSSTTIKDYVDALSKGHYTSFIMFNNVPSDCPYTSTNTFVEIIVYSATTSMVRLTPVGTTADNKMYVLTKSGGTWRSWYKYEGSAVT